MATKNYGVYNPDATLMMDLFFDNPTWLAVFQVPVNGTLKELAFTPSTIASVDYEDIPCTIKVARRQGFLFMTEAEITFDRATNWGAADTIWTPDSLGLAVSAGDIFFVGAFDDGAGAPSFPPGVWTFQITE